MKHTVKNLGSMPITVLETNAVAIHLAPGNSVICELHSIVHDHAARVRYSVAPVFERPRRAAAKAKAKR